jgi:hypothetical protein
MQTNLFNNIEEPTDSIYSLIKQIDLINDKIKVLQDKKSKYKQVKKITEVNIQITELKEQGDNIWKKIK